MPLDGNGNFSLVSGNPVVTNTIISSTTHNNTMDDIKNALSNAMYKDGQATPTANIKMGGFKHTGLAAGTTAGDSVRFDEFDTLSSAVSILQSTGTVGFKNRIINGAMMIDQRNAGASVTNTTSQTYTVDRFRCYGAQASKFSVQQSSTAPAGFKNSLLITSLSAYTVGSSEIFEFSQAIEGFNAADLGFGAATASTVTVSFWVRSSLTGTFGGALNNSASNRCYPFTYTISAANTWEQKSITIAGDTTGTWLTDTGVGISVRFGLGVGSSFSGTAGVWASSTYTSATGATSVVGTNGATFYITGVQLEKGSTATSFDYRPYGTELALCQRYYQGPRKYMWLGYATAGGGYGFWIPFVQTVRTATPTVALSGAYVNGFGAASVIDFNDNGTRIQAVSSTTGAGLEFSGSFTVSAEL